MNSVVGHPSFLRSRLKCLNFRFFRSLRCPFDIDDTDGSAHSIKGYQVFVTCEGEDGDRKRKGLFGANLGKLLHQVRTEEVSCSSSSLTACYF